MNFNYKKILIIGCGGAGKSTLAAALGKKLDLLEFFIYSFNAAVSHIGTGFAVKYFDAVANSFYAYVDCIIGSKE